MDKRTEVQAEFEAATSERQPAQDDFPDWFVSMIEPGEDLADFLDARRQRPRTPVKL